MKYKIVTYNTSNSICAINKSILLFFDLLEVDASTLEPRSVLFYELLSSFFLKKWVNNPKVAHEPRFLKLNYHPLNKMTKILNKY